MITHYNYETTIPSTTSLDKSSGHRKRHQLARNIRLLPSTCLYRLSRQLCWRTTRTLHERRYHGTRCTRDAMQTQTRTCHSSHTRKHHHRFPTPRHLQSQYLSVNHQVPQRPKQRLGDLRDLWRRLF